MDELWRSLKSVSCTAMVCRGASMQGYTASKVKLHEINLLLQSDSKAMCKGMHDSLEVCRLLIFVFFMQRQVPCTCLR